LTSKEEENKNGKIKREREARKSYVGGSLGGSVKTGKKKIQVSCLDAKGKLKKG